MSPEPYYTISELASATGFPPRYIREACNRSRAFHQLPHIKSGHKRPHHRICLSDWMQWLEEEKER